MTTRSFVEVSCDIGGEAEADTYTILVSVRGGAGLAGYEIDLCDDHAGPLKDVIARARAVKARPVRAKPSRTMRDRELAAAVRARAQADGVILKPHGRIPDKIRKQYGG